MKKITIYTSIFLAALVLVIACKKEKPEIGNFEICDCESPVSADFDIFETMGSNVVGTDRVLTDHILTTRWAIFSAKEVNASYKWYIGSEILTDREVSRFFSQQWENYNIPVTLVVEKEPNLKCFPNDDGYDSVVKIMQVKPKMNNPHLARGIFRVADIGSVDSFEMSILFDFYEPYIPPYNCTIINYDGNNTSCSTYDTQIWLDKLFYRFLSSGEFDYTDNCRKLQFHVYFPPPSNNLIEVEVRYLEELNPNSPTVIRKYRGRRI
jgi:hypothetical protein